MWAKFLRKETHSEHHCRQLLPFLFDYEQFQLTFLVEYYERFWERLWHKGVSINEQLCPVWSHICNPKGKACFRSSWENPSLYPLSWSAGETGLPCLFQRNPLLGPFVIGSKVGNTKPSVLHWPHSFPGSFQPIEQPLPYFCTKLS